MTTEEIALSVIALALSLPVIGPVVAIVGVLVFAWFKARGGRRGEAVNAPQGAKIIPPRGGSGTAAPKVPKPPSKPGFTGSVFIEGSKLEFVDGRLVGAMDAAPSSM